MPLPTPEEEAEFKRKYRESKAAPKVETAPPPVDTTRRRQVMSSGARGGASEAEMGLQSEEDKLLQQYIAEIRRQNLCLIHI